MNWKMGFVVCVCVLISSSLPVMAVFEVPEGAVTFESLGLSRTYDSDTAKFQTKEVTLQFAEPSEVKIVLYTFRYEKGFETEIYVNGLLATKKWMGGGGNKETTMAIPGAFIESGENTIYIEFIDVDRDTKFSNRPVTIAQKSYILSVDPLENGPVITPINSLSSPSPTPTEKSLIPTQTQTDTKGFSIIDIQKSSETSPEINIEPIESQKLPNTTVLLRGTASSDSGIKSVTINGNYVGTEYWNMPFDLSLGENSVVIVATDNEGNTTIENVRLTATTPESESKRSSHVLYFVAFIGAIATIVAAIIIARYTKKEK